MTRTTLSGGLEPRPQRQQTIQEKYLAACDANITASAKKYLRYFNGALDLDDLIQIGRMVVLKKVVKYYNPARGTTLQTFAYNCIVGELRRLIRTTELRGLLRPDQRAAWGRAMRRRDEARWLDGLGLGEAFAKHTETDPDADNYNRDYATSHAALVERLHAESTLKRFEALPPDLWRIFVALVQTGWQVRPAARALGKPYNADHVRAGRDAIVAWAREQGITP